MSNQLHSYTCTCTYRIAGNFRRCKFSGKWSQGLQNEFRILIFVRLRAQIMPSPLVSHRFVGIFYCCRANVCGQGTTGYGRGSERWKYRYNTIARFTFPHGRSPVQNLMQIKILNGTFFTVLLSYDKASYKIYKNLYWSKIPAITVYFYPGSLGPGSAHNWEISVTQSSIP